VNAVLEQQLGNRCLQFPIIAACNYLFSNLAVHPSGMSFASLPSAPGALLIQ
jgi:hypothetical protein